MRSCFWSQSFPSTKRETMINAAGDYVTCFIVSRFVDGKDWLQKQLRK